MVVLLERGELPKKKPDSMRAPSASKNDLSRLLDLYCSDKGTWWMSRHHYSTAYHTILHPIRDRIQSMIEVGIGEDTAPSISAWSEYLPNANIYAIDIVKKEDMDRRRREGTLDRLKRRQKDAGCKHNEALWDDRVVLTTDVDATSATSLARASLPAESSAQLIVDDGSHRMQDQDVTLGLLWDRLSPGGVYVIEDVFVGALPWSKEHGNLVPSKNYGCGHECYYPQRLSEHPFMFDRFDVGGVETKRHANLSAASRRIFEENDWFWVVTGVHQGGGLDCSVIIRKSGELGMSGASETGLAPHPLDHATPSVTVPCASMALLWLSLIANGVLGFLWHRAKTSTAAMYTVYSRVSQD